MTNTTTTPTNEKELSIEVLKQLAYMQHEGEDFFIVNGTPYIGDEEAAKESYEAAKEDYESFADFCENECDEVEDFDNDDYLVLTDEEADEKAADYIKDSLWAFNASFLSSETGYPIEVFESLQDFKNNFSSYSLFFFSKASFAVRRDLRSLNRASNASCLPKIYSCISTIASMIST